MAISPQGELLLSDNIYHCIKTVSPDKVVRVLFGTQWRPNQLCCLHNGDVAVTFQYDSKVVIYSRSGKIIQELNQKLFRYPIKVAQNKFNNDFYICDRGRKIIALDTSYHLKYEYIGQGNTNFIPKDICTDSAGHVLITDTNRVHILDKDGQFLQHLLTREQRRGLQGLMDYLTYREVMSEPLCIDVDSEGNAWVAHGDGKVKVVKYLK